ncbi:hypothetical protein OMO38_16125 [Chryseobacterium sp. 09-1422]|uniref:Uncharacterized protein n=1 Tax=Chryseobacterium kimseyorum TaxID=2984028 RepID=A0ABT3I1Z6_9FLAO|nr:hypothetical protein [Chryseobacterium kimseyorum]MCW3170053.1 hypothetical protein [Chryseobacterium kimseyorum]
MRRILLIIIVVSSIGILNAQTMANIFCNMPSEYTDNLSVLERKELVKTKTFTNDDISYTLKIDEKNGYLRLEQYYTEGQSGYQIFEMAYWSLENKKLVALSSVGGSNGGFFQNNFKLFEHKNNVLTELKTGYLKSYSSNFDVFMNSLVREFTNKNVKQSVIDDLIYAQFTIELPKNGRDLLISFKENGMSSPDFFEKNYAKYLKFREKRYVWNADRKLFEY